MEALNNQTNIDDLINLESIQGGLDCNVDEVGGRLDALHILIVYTIFSFQVIKHELSMEGSLDFNFPMNNHHHHHIHHHHIHNNVNANNTQETTLSAISNTQNPNTTTHSHGQYTNRSSVTPPSWVH